MEKKSRGTRNNNPGNLRYTKVKWAGKVPDKEKKDKEFEEFTSMFYGMRAACKNMLTISSRLGAFASITEVIEVWAPESDGNRPKAYAWMVKTGVEKYQKDNKLETTEIMERMSVGAKAAMMKAIFEVETGEKFNMKECLEAMKAAINSTWAAS